MSSSAISEFNKIDAELAPHFIDADKDGDYDLMMGGEYYDYVGKYAYNYFFRGIMFFENIGDASSPEFELQFLNSIHNDYDESDGTFVDIDGDGDMDIMVGDERGFIEFYENTNPSPVPGTLVTVINYPPDSGPLVIDNNLTLSDPDGDNIIGATVTIQDFRFGEEILNFIPSGGITGTFDPVTGILTLSGTAPHANYQTVLRTVTYEFIGGKPLSGERKGFGTGRSVLLNRIIDFTAIDTDLSSSAAIGIPVSITWPNEVPSISGTPGSERFKTGAVVIDAGISLVDNDDADLEGATVQITPTTFVNGQDQLIFVDQLGITGSYDNATGILTLTGTAPISDYQIALRTVLYNNTAGLANPQNRNIEFFITDGEDISNITTKLVAINQGPTLTTAVGQTSYQGVAVEVDNSIVISDPDDPMLADAYAQITNNYVQAEDQLLFTDQNGITGSFNAALGLLTLTGTASVADYQAALRSIRYNNTSATPNSQTRTVEFSVSDGALSSSADSRDITINVIPANQPPIITASPITTQIGNVVTIDLTTLVSDPDGNIDVNSFSIIQQPQSGAPATISGSTLSVNYTSIGFAGTDLLRIEVCDLAGACTQQDLMIVVEGDIIVFGGISPNGDGLNDVWIIQNINTLEPQNKVSLFNRWGDKVFEIENYDNNSRVFKGMNDNGKDLPSGVYFYKIEFISGREIISGYLTIKR
ncbi:MAG: gliding motility-associated C-terminal domain-containing protein [Flammeovirgaceae bacterium]|nr:gliding motility-associated C-terminal domain-containing protein [Flammeovirgaceae bacterium]